MTNERPHFVLPKIKHQLLLVAESIITLRYIGSQFCQEDRELFEVSLNFG